MQSRHMMGLWFGRRARVIGLAGTCGEHLVSSCDPNGSRRRRARSGRERSGQSAHGAWALGAGASIVRGDSRHKVWDERVVVRRVLASAVACLAAVVAWGAGAPGALAFSPPRIYWANIGGNTIGEANLDGTAVNQSLTTGASGPVGVPVSVPVATTRSASPPLFASTPQQSVSGPLTLTLTNNGQRSLVLSGLSFVGADGGDFLVGADTCIAAIVPGAQLSAAGLLRPRGPGPARRAPSDREHGPTAVRMAVAVPVVCGLRALIEGLAHVVDARSRESGS